MEEKITSKESNMRSGSKKRFKKVPVHSSEAKRNKCFLTNEEGNSADCYKRVENTQGLRKRPGIWLLGEPQKELKKHDEDGWGQGENEEI